MKISRIQIEMINNAMAAYSKTEPSHPAITPLSVCVAMIQAYIGYDLQNALKEELLNRGIKKNVATVITQVRVDENDPAFEHPTKPSGQFMTKELFEILSAIEEEHGIAGAHCENGDIIKAVTEKLKAEERNSIRLHPKSRLAEAEAEAVNRLLTIAKLAGTPVNIVH